MVPLFKYAKVDCTANRDLCKRFNIKKYPTIIYWKKHKKQQEYAGGKLRGKIRDWAKLKANDLKKISKAMGYSKEEQERIKKTFKELEKKAKEARKRLEKANKEKRKQMREGLEKKFGKIKVDKVKEDKKAIIYQRNMNILRMMTERGLFKPRSSDVTPATDADVTPATDATKPT